MREVEQAACLTGFEPCSAVFLAITFEIGASAGFLSPLRRDLVCTADFSAAPV
jgi:hypothetical protein